MSARTSSILSGLRTAGATVGKTTLFVLEVASEAGAAQVRADIERENLAKIEDLAGAAKNEFDRIGSLGCQASTTDALRLLATLSEQVDGLEEALAELSVDSFDKRIARQSIRRAELARAEAIRSVYTSTF